MENQQTENNEIDEEEISAPLVFSCLKCRAIVGDSFSFM
jgi:hypothetical protein